MGLLISKEFYKSLISSLEESREIVIIYSAFVKTDALIDLSVHIDESVDVYLIARFNKKDIVTGATDLDIYEVCKKNEWKLGVDLNLHGKLFMFDYKKILLGSANLTSKGMSINTLGNLEFGVCINPTDFDLSKIEDLLKKTVWVDDHLYDLLIGEIKNTSVETRIEDMNWSSALLQSLHTNIDYLWVNDLPYSDPESLLLLDMNNDDHVHDYYLYDLNIDSFSENKLKLSFLRSRACLWLKEVLNKGGSANFGKISSLLHNALLDDPKPYRKTVKEFVARLFQWVEYSCDDVIVTHHERTVSIKLR